MKRLAIVLSCLLPLLLASCASRAPLELKGQVQFKLDIGKMDNQIDLIQRRNVPNDQKIRIVMQNGFYYIGNGSAFKVMEFSSYGDLLSLFYNKSENPQPVLLTTEKSKGSTANRMAYPYPFREVGEIAVMRDGTLLVEDAAAPERREFDSKLDAMLQNIVLRFGPDGKLIDYLGQDGIGGTPFPYIMRLQVSENDEIVVICRTMTQWMIYRYSAKGEPISTITISNDKLPSPAADLTPTVDTIFASPDSRYLYTKINYFKPETAQTASGESNVNYYQSDVYWMNSDTGKFEGSFSLPTTSQSAGANAAAATGGVLLYQFIGVADNGLLYFLSPVGDGHYELSIVNTHGRVVSRSRLSLSDETTIYRTFYVSPDGILNAFIGKELEADVEMWRTDKLIAGDTSEAG